MGPPITNGLSTEPKHPALVSPPNTVALPAIITGCKVFAQRPDELDPVKAEVLGIRPAKAGRRPRSRPFDNDVQRAGSGKAHLDTHDEKLEF